MGFPSGSVVTNPPARVGEAGLIPELGRSPGGGNGNPLQYSCLENSTDRGLAGYIVQGVVRAGHNCATEHTHVSLQTGTDIKRMLQTTLCL